MLRVGQKEIDEVAKSIASGQLFRYGDNCQCSRFERRYARSLDIKHAYMTASGTNALTAALIGVRIGPGDEVLVPACTYMATAVAVLAAGAIPVVVDVDATTTISPAAIRKAIGPRTRAIMPVHMWGLPCNMDAIMRIARKHKLLVVEDACQAVGGGYKGRMLGTIGNAGGFSFNYFKNMTCGEGGAVVSDDDDVMQRARCHVDCCGFYWNGREGYKENFVSSGARASEIEGAMLNAQLSRLPGMLRTCRKHKQRTLAETADSGLTPVPSNSPDDECGTTTAYMLPSAEQAEELAKRTQGGVMRSTGRHVYTEWDPIFQHKGGHHPALNPFLLKENKACRKDYSVDMCRKSLDILGRTVMYGNNPRQSRAEITARIKAINSAAKEIL